MDFYVGQKIAFYHHSRGRGSHVTAFAEITKINRKSVKATELPGSYGAGTLWTMNKEWLNENLAGMWNSVGYNQPQGETV